MEYLDGTTLKHLITGKSLELDNKHKQLYRKYLNRP